MGASNFVGRVGGLAVALGVGAAMFSGSAVAWADRGGDGGASAGDDSGSSSSAPAHAHRGPGSAAAAGAGAGAAAATSSRGNSTQADVSVAVTIPDVQVKNAPVPTAAATAPLAASAVAPAAVEPEAAVAPIEPSSVVIQSDPDPVDVPAVKPVVDTPTDPIVTVPIQTLIDPVVIADPAPEMAPAGDIQVINYAVGSDGSNGASSDNTLPGDSPLVDAVLASFIRRETTSPAAATDSPSALVTSSATSTAPITLDPKTTYFDGIIQGNLNVKTASGCGLLGSDCKLDYSLAGSSAGGKATFDKVPGALPLGGASSFTFIPYATWIDPAKPTSNPTPSGTQDFTVRVSENTKFDQTLRAIPLIGDLIFKPIIGLLQQTPLIGTLLAPLIGNTITQTIAVNLNQLVPAGKQVAYTYKVTSFDGTLISMNYFPAAAPSLILPGEKQATIFNGPGLGGAGTIDPYGSNQGSGSVPGLALMRGQGLPGPLATAPLGFNVITWDPRGEWESGGILQLDNPFYEGRDVSSLIDWANANTPLLSEGGKLDVAMMGGSYGGGIQMSTVDPRIKSIVPSIAWNSLNNSLYPDGIFKTAWANTLAQALLLTGASSISRVNSQITQALITGNLFAFVSQTAQAVLSSSGPTALLTKLNIPTMYDQSTTDALFPLQQALDNARTQLEQNPFFVGKADLVKMIWFCGGGHSVCTNQTFSQLGAQSTVMFLENIAWVNKYTKDYLAGDPTINGLISAIAPFQWWDQKGTALASYVGMPWTSAFQNTAPIVASQTTGGRINSFTSVSGPLTTEDAAAQFVIDPTTGKTVCGSISAACSFPLNQVFATKAKNAVNVDIPLAATGPKYIVGAPKVSFTYSGIGNAKAVYAQIVDNATGQVLGNINTPIPVTLDGKEHTIDAFSIADIAYTAPGTAGASLTLQIVANSSLYQNTSVNWGVSIDKITVSLPTTGTAIPNPVPGLIPA